MSTFRIALLAFFLGVVVLSLIFYNDATYTVTPRFSPRPPYPPFRPPPLNDPPPSPPPPPPHNDSHWPEHDTNAIALLWTSRATSVREAFLHAYRNYEKYAPFPADELLPLSNQSVLNFNGWGVTMVDSLDTMHLLGLEAEFDRAVSHVASINFSMPANHYASFFETIIRYLGGFLSAYALSGEPIMLSRAEDLANRLMPAFNSPSGMPYSVVNPQTKELLKGTRVFFSEVTSCQMEYKYLAHLTGRAEYFTSVEKIMDLLNASQPADHGMWPTVFEVTDGKPFNLQYSVGSFADSGYEYLLKQYLLSGKTEHRLAEMYMESMTGMLENLMFLSPTRNLLYITDTIGLIPSRNFEHLSCFFPGLLALGAETLPESLMSAEQKELHMWAAEGLAHTCWVTYMDQPSGLGPEIVTFEGWGHRNGPTSAGQPNDNWKQERWMRHVEQWQMGGKQGGKPPGVRDAGMPVQSGEGKRLDYTILRNSYFLRPETLESMFVMYRVTRDVKWRIRGWQIWEAIEAKTRTASGYACVDDVDKAKPTLTDSMPSYFLAETVKYAYLLAVNEDPWPMEKWVLNTEAHPFPVFSWRDWERRRYGIAREPLGFHIHN